MRRRTTVWLSETQIERLHSLARKTKVPAAELIRRFVDAGLDKESAKYFELLGPGGRPVALIRGYTLSQMKAALRREKSGSENVVFLESGRKSKSKK